MKILSILFLLSSLALAHAGGICDATGGCTRTTDWWAIYLKGHRFTNTIILGGKNYTMPECRTLLLVKNSPDQSIVLAREMIACRLNFLSGCKSDPIRATIHQAHKLFVWRAGKVPYGIIAPKPAAPIMANYATAIRTYNEGKLGQ